MSKRVVKIVRGRPETKKEKGATLSSVHVFEYEYNKDLKGDGWRFDAVAVEEGQPQPPSNAIYIRHNHFGKEVPSKIKITVEAE